jgi:hypothetical protein
MAMKDLALTKEEAAEDYGECAPTTGDKGDDGPKYPWGTRLCLDDDILAKLGLGLLPVGTELVIMAKATVVGTSTRERVKGEREDDMDVQITAMDVTQSLTTDRTAKAAKKLYPDAD